MLKDFNLLISTSRGNERNACSELWYLLGELGDKDAKVDVTPVLGLVTAKTNLNPLEVINKLRIALKEKPWEFKYILKIVPIEMVIPANLEELKKISSSLVERIGKDEKFRISVEKRHTSLSSMDVIKAIAEGIDRKVDLKNPDKIILVEIIGNLAGISVIKPTYILSIEKEKRNI
ncbi:MAG: THUMP domain-containing protein [Candidatus Bathyarchaeia archaeon]